jgi:uncharacterized protein
MSTSSDRGSFVWHEVGTTDLQAGEDFYSRIAGWKADSWSQNPSYKIFSARREPKAGLYLITDAPNTLTLPPHWLSYIGTPDVDATVRQAVELGGKVMVPAYNVPNVGRMAHLQYPQGGLFAVSSQEDRLRHRDPQVGDFSWHELMTSNAQTAFDFYAKLFGWEKMEAMDMGPQGTYQIFGAGGRQLGGVFNPGPLPRGPVWIPYVLVADVRRTSEIAKEFGATITHGPSEVPGGDWVFTGVDRQGAVFAAHSKKRVVPIATKKVAPKKETTKKIVTKKTHGTKNSSGRTRLQSRKKPTSKRR